jgi:superfamily II DNA or RNA helicase
VVQLRPYQKQKIEEIYEAWQNHRSVMLQMPTGTGKTVLFNQIVKDELANNSKVLIIAHRKELIDQNVSRLWNDFRIQAGTITANGQCDLSIPVQVAMIQTLSKRNKQEVLDFNPSTVIIDEAHHVPAKSYRELWETYPDAKFLGVTATPIRLNGEGFKDLFDTLIVSKSIEEFIEDGYLAKLKYIGRPPLLPKLDLSDIDIVGGDYDSDQLSEKMCEEAVMANLIKSYLDHAKGKKMIVFAVTTKHSESIAERYQSIGFAAAHIDSDTPQKERNETINKFRSGEIQILSNVGIISEGFDAPDCEVVQLARPTKSEVMYLQQVGRCMRPSRSKPYSIVLDNVGLYEEFGSPKRHRNWSLDATTRTKPDNIDGDSNENFAREPLEEVDETLIVLEDVEMNTVDELKDKVNELDKKIKKLLDQIRQLEEMGGFQEAIDGLLKQIKDSQSDKERIERELKESLDLQQDNRLKDLLEEFQYYIDSFFEDAKWETEEDRLTFVTQLKVSYDKSKEKSLATLCETIVPIIKPIIDKPFITTPSIPQPIIPENTSKKDSKKNNLQVKFRGKFIQGKDQSQVFVNTVKEIGVQKVKNLDLSFGIDLVSEEKAPTKPNMSRPYTQHLVEGYWICTHMSGKVKEETLQKIARELGENIEVKLI